MSLTPVKNLWHLSAVRQSFWFLIVFSTITVLAWGGTYLLVWHEMIKAVDQRLSTRMEIVLDSLQLNNSLPQAGDNQTSTLTNDQWPSGFQSVDVEDGDGPDMRYLVRATPQGNIVLGESVEREENLRSILAVGMQITLAFTIIATIIFSLVLAKRSQRRLDSINQNLKQVESGNLNARIVLDGEDDLSQLARRINHTTERLAHSMEQMHVQSSNIAHDLRTPLARLRGQLEVCLENLKEKKQQVEEDDLEEALEQIDNIEDIFEALLRLAKIKNRESRANFKTLNLKDFANDVVETFGPVVADAGQTLKVQSKDAKSISADSRLLMQLVANLIQNALSYAKDGKEIIFGLDGTTISITDQGPGLHPAEHEKVMQPLYQGENSRFGTGHGLGLAMVKAISDLHEATITFSSGSNSQGLGVLVSFPTHSEA